MDNIDQPTPIPEEPASDDEAAARQRHLEFMRSVTVPNHREHNWRPAITLAVVLVLVAVIGLGVYWQFFRGGTSSSPAAKTHKQAAANSSSAPSVPTQTYTSSDFNLSLNYPDGWTVVDSGNGPMTVTSPAMPLTAAAGQAVTGQITMTIQQQGQLPAGFSAGTALAVLNSQQITYAQPTASQNSRTYLSFVQYAATTAKGGLDAIYLTGNDGYKKGQVIPTGDVATISPLVVVAFTKCGNSACTSNLTPLTIASTSWNNSAFQAPITTMLASLAFQ